jgi:hypothetical protein
LLFGDVTSADDPLSYSSIEDIRELDQTPENPDFAPVAESKTGELDHSPHSETGELVPAEPSFRERSAALSARLVAQQAHPTASPDDPDAPDPLAGVALS